MSWDFYKKIDFYNSLDALFEEAKKYPTVMITVWIPLDHEEFTNEDQQKVNKLGKEIDALLKPFKAGHGATSHASGKIGLVVAGMIVNDEVRQKILPLLKLRCPQETYFTVEEIFDDKDEIDTFDIPLFESGEVAICEKF